MSCPHPERVVQARWNQGRGKDTLAPAPCLSVRGTASSSWSLPDVPTQAGRKKSANLLKQKRSDGSSPGNG